MKIPFCVFVLLCLIYVNIVSSFPSNKSCAEWGLLPMKGFVKEEYLGLWFSHQVYDLDFPGYDCYVIIRKPRPDGNVDVIDTMIKPDGVPVFSTDGLETYNYPGEGRHLYSSTNGPPEYNGGEYIILKTDYTSYYIESRCTEVSGGSLVEIYVFTRLPIVPFFTQKEIDKVIKDHGFNTTAIIPMDISSCPSKLIRGVGSGHLLTGILKLVTDLLGLLGGVLRAVGGLLGGLLG